MCAFSLVFFIVIALTEVDVQTPGGCGCLFKAKAYKWAAFLIYKNSIVSGGAEFTAFTLKVNFTVGPRNN